MTDQPNADLAAEIREVLEDEIKAVASGISKAYHGGASSIDLDVYVDKAEQALLSIFQQHKKAELTSLLAKLPDCDSGCKHKTAHQGHNSLWWTGYSQARNECRAIIQEAITAIEEKT